MTTVYSRAPRRRCLSKLLGTNRQWLPCQPLTWLPIVALAVSLAGPPPQTQGCGTYPTAEQAELSRLQVALTAPDAALRQETIRELRARGPAGLELAVALLQSPRLAGMGPLPSPPTDSSPPVPSEESCRRSVVAAYSAEERQRLIVSVDEIAGQYLGHISRLYWYTDREAANAAARDTGRPVLNLRMLGRLHEQFSCANSRFFRTAFYCDPDISHYLRENFVLLWESVRDVPVITIDFGQGRELRRTLTGNSAHYVTLADGTIIDGLPGLYTPTSFRTWLEECHIVARQLQAETAHPYAQFLSDEPPSARLRTWHAQQADRLQARFAEAQQFQQQPQTVPLANAKAVLADRRALAKSIVEAPLLNAVIANSERPPADSASGTTPTLLTMTGQIDWRALAQGDLERVVLSEVTRALIASELTANELPASDLPGEDTATANSASSESLQAAVDNFKLAMLADELHNELDLHRQLHLWLAGSDLNARRISSNIDELNQRVYAELFSMNLSDPWLGLKPENVVTGLSGTVSGLSE